MLAAVRMRTAASTMDYAWMPRRSFLIRHVKNRAPAEGALGRYLHVWHTGDLYSKPESFPAITSQALFGNDRPLDLEIGCGTGEFLCALAERDPAANFAGVDFNLKSLYVAVAQASALSLQNIKFVKASVQYLYPLLEPDSLRTVYFHFPDPSLRPKYRKRRLYNDSFFGQVDRALVPGGHLSIVTDSQELFTKDILPFFEHEGRFERTHAERYLTGYEPPVKSRYQQYWEGHGATIYRLELRKKS